VRTRNHERLPVDELPAEAVVGETDVVVVGQTMLRPGRHQALLATGGEGGTSIACSTDMPPTEAQMMGWIEEDCARGLRPAGFARERLALRTIDPDGDFDTLTRTLPFGRQLQAVMEPAIEAGANAFVGIFDAPWESCSYYVPCDGEVRPIPGVWVSRSDGERL